MPSLTKFFILADKPASTGCNDANSMCQVVKLGGLPKLVCCPQPTGAALPP